MNEFEKLKLNKFKLKDILPNATMLLLGRRRTGKSFLARDIFFNHKEIPSGLVFSGTENANPFFGDFIPDSFIHSIYDSELVQSVLKSQAKKVRKARDALQDPNGLLAKNRFFMVLDDMLADANSWKKDKTIKEIFMNGRHFNIFFLLTLQYATGIPPELRNNIDYVFIFNEPSIKNRKKIYEDYAGMIPSFDAFNNILDSCTQNYECLVIKTAAGTSSDIKDLVFWYKAEYHENFKVGHPSIWKYHNERYNDKYNSERDKDQENLDKLRIKYGNSRKLKVIVSKEDGEIIDYIEESN